MRGKDLFTLHSTEKHEGERENIAEVRRGRRHKIAENWEAVEDTRDIINMSHQYVIH